MTARSKITRLPAAVRAWLDSALAEKGFADYKLLEAELAKRGYSIGRSSIHRYGAALERRLSAIKASTEAARAIALAAPDDADMRSAAVISLVQTQTFETLVQMEEATKEEDPVQRAKVLALVAKNIATLSRASVHQKKHELDVRGRAQAVAEKVARLAKNDGASKATQDEIRREILGIAA